MVMSGGEESAEASPPALLHVRMAYTSVLKGGDGVSCGSGEGESKRVAQRKTEDASCVSDSHRQAVRPERHDT